MGTCDPNCSCNVTCSRVCTSVGGCSGYHTPLSSASLTVATYYAIRSWINTFRSNFGYSGYTGAPSGAVTAASWNTHVRDAAQLPYYKWNGSTLQTITPSISTAVPGTSINNNPPNSVASELNNHRCYTVHTSTVCVSVCSCVGDCGCDGYCACDSYCGSYCPCVADCGCDTYCAPDCGCDTYCAPEGGYSCECEAETP